MYDWNGLLEINLNGEWGAVCQTMWTTENSRVACRQLGYADVLQERENKQRIADKYLIDMVTCNGKEASVCFLFVIFSWS